MRSWNGIAIIYATGMKVFTFPISVWLGGCSSFEKTVLKNEQQIHHISKTTENTLPAFLDPSDRDTIISFDHELDLYELLDLAFARNPETKIAWRQAALASAQKTKIDSAFYPHVTASLNAARAEQLNAPDSDGKHLTTSLSNVIYPQIEISYSLFKFGAHKESSQVALSTLKAANFQYNQALQDVAYRVELAYFSLDSAIAIVKANEQNLEDAKVALDAAQSRHQSGLANRQDLLKAQAAHSAAAFELENSRSAVESARAHLAVAIGVRVNDGLRVVTSNTQAIPDVDELENLIEKSLKMRQDMRAKWELLAAKQHGLEAKKYDQYPELIAGLRASRKKIQDTPGMYNNFEAYLGFRWDIFDGHLKMAERLMAHEELEIARQQLKAKALGVVGEVWEYFYVLKSAIKKLDSAQNSERCAWDAANYAQEAYTNGLCSFTDLLTSQNALSVARKQLVCAKNDLSVSWVRLAYYTGKILEK
ncbi:MAG: TolC family protein [Puniceicoccales bacterium]|jgi:outer membrane protein|nr:TolC family protein [Puniceicoccales bacterium]